VGERKEERGKRREERGERREASEVRSQYPINCAHLQ
jgi:hypothetical protein